MQKDGLHRVLLVGDVVMGDRRSAPDSVKTLVGLFNCDRVLANAEIPLTERGSPADKFVAWRTGPAVARRMRELGFDLVSLANNHALDYGPEGVFDTIVAFHAAGIDTVGAGPTLGDALAPAILALDERTKIAVLGVACTLPLGYAAAEDRPGVAPVRVSTRYEFDPRDLQEEPGCQPTFIHTCPDLEDLARICDAITHWRNRGYLVFVSIHWGNAFQKQLAQYQRPVARAFQEAGCSLVIGHHPHTFHGIEVVGKMPVLYSLGNFIMEETIVHGADSGLPEGLATPWVMSPEALVAVAEIEDSRLRALRVYPIVLDGGGFPSRALGEAGEKILRDTAQCPPATPPWVLQGAEAVISLASKRASDSRPGMRPRE